MKPMCKICKLEVSKKVLELDNLSFLNEGEEYTFLFKIPLDDRD